MTSKSLHKMNFLVFQISLGCHFIIICPLIFWTYKTLTQLHPSSHDCVVGKTWDPPPFYWHITRVFESLVNVIMSQL